MLMKWALLFRVSKINKTSLNIISGYIIFCIFYNYIISFSNIIVVDTPFGGIYIYAVRALEVNCVVSL